MPTLLKSFETGGDSDEPVGDLGGNEYDIAQSFTLDSTATVGSLELYFKKQNTITDPVTVRIETSNSNLPSGTLVDASATTTFTPTSTSYSWLTVTFPASFSLTGSTKYWIKCTVPNQSTNNCYFWYRDTGSGYPGHGESLSFDGGAFGAESATIDLYFRVYQAEASSGNFLLFMQ